MPRSPSPDRRRRSPSPSRGRDRDGDRSRDRSRSPSRKQWSQRRPKELSFYKRGAPSVLPPGAAPLAGEVGEEETAKERAQRRERGEVPRRYGGTREQGVRNTMGNAISAPAASIGSFKRTADPLDRMGVRGEKDSGRDREREREREHRSGDRDRRDRDRGDRDRRDRDREREHRRDRDRDRERGERRDEPRDTRHPDRAAASGSGDGKGNGPVQIPAPTVRPGRMIEVIANDRMGRKVRIKCLPTDTVGDLKRLIAAQTGTSAQKIVLKKWYTAFKDHVQLQDYEINDGMSLEMY